MRKSNLIKSSGIIIIINVVIFFIYAIVHYIYGDSILSYLALQPASILLGKNLWTLITSMFLHASIGHLFANMVSLIFLGGFTERLIGKKRFLSLYFLGGLSASFFFIILAGLFGTSELGARLFGSPYTFAVGASGAIFALGGLLAVLIPKMKVLVFFIIPMPMWVAMGFFTFIMWIFSVTLYLPIGNTAHLGGLVAGIAYGFYIRKKYPRKTRLIAKYFSQ